MRPSPLALRHVCALLSSVLLAALLVSVGAPPVARDVEATASSTYLCHGYTGCRGEGYSDAGYGAVNHRMYWDMYPGHNCTNYVAYRMIRAGMPTARPFGYPGNASHWGRHRSDITDGTPRVGAVAWWDAHDNGSGSAGHVAYVERVEDGGNTIVISEDSWGGTFHWRRIDKGSGRWPSGFIHFIDKVVQNVERPKLSGWAKVGKRVRTSDGVWNVENPILRYQWFADGTPIAGETSSSIAVRPEFYGKRLQARITGYKPGFDPGRGYTWKSRAIMPGDIAPDEPPTISGDPVAGATLTADPGTYAPAPDAVDYQWLAGDEPIPGATGRTFELTPEQVDSHVRVRVTAKKASYEPRTVDSEPTDSVLGGYLRLKEAPRVTGWRKVGNVLTAHRGAVWPDWRVETTYQWLRDGTAIDGATGQRYRLTPEDHQRRISVRVTHRHPTRLGLEETSPAGNPVRATPAMKVAPIVRGHRVIIRADLSNDVNTPMKGRVTVWYAGRRKTVELSDGVAWVPFYNVPTGRHGALVNFHQNWKFTRVHQRLKVAVPQ